MAGKFYKSSGEYAVAVSSSLAPMAPTKSYVVTARIVVVAHDIEAARYEIETECGGLDRFVEVVAVEELPA